MAQAILPTARKLDIYNDNRLYPTDLSEIDLAKSISQRWLRIKWTQIRNGLARRLKPLVRKAAAANQWFAELHSLFAPVRKELSKTSEATIDRRIARAAKAVRARKRGET